MRRAGMELWVRSAKCSGKLYKVNYAGTRV
jgi:hypothetical protein